MKLFVTHFISPVVKLNFCCFLCCRYRNSSDSHIELMTPKVMSHLQPDAKLIAILRDPVTATYSSFNFFTVFMTNPTPEEFHKCVTKCLQIFYACEKRYDSERCTIETTNEDNLPFPRKCSWVLRSLRLGRYVVFLKQWMKYFPRKNFYIVRMEEYSKSKRSTITRIWDFLGVRTIPLYKERELGVHTEAVNHNSYHENMLTQTEELLRSFFDGPNKELKVLLKDRLFTWRK